MALATIFHCDSVKGIFNMLAAPCPGWLIAFSAHYLLAHNLLPYLELLRLVIIKIKLPTIAEITAAINKPAFA